MPPTTGHGRARVTNRLLAGQIVRPVTVPPPDDRPAVTVHVEFEDGGSGDLPGIALGWSAAAVVVHFDRPDGSPQEEWFPTNAVHRL